VPPSDGVFSSLPSSSLTIGFGLFGRFVSTLSIVMIMLIRTNKVHGRMGRGCVSRGRSSGIVGSDKNFII
jgi:hypothetical protein